MPVDADVTITGINRTKRLVTADTSVLAHITYVKKQRQQRSGDTLGTISPWIQTHLHPATQLGFQLFSQGEKS